MMFDTPSLPPFELPFEYRFDVPTAAKSLAELARSEPDAPIVLNIAQVNPWHGIEQEKDVTMRAEEAAALLATVGVDQQVPKIKSDGSTGEIVESRELYVLRVSRP